MLQIKPKLKKFGYIATVILCLASMPGVANAVYDENFYAGNDILFYNPGDTGCIGSGSSAFTSADTIANQEATAKFLTSTNFAGNNNKPLNAIQMAAIMGNIQQESGFNPSAGEGGAHVGIAQWNSPGRWDSISDPKTNLDNQLNFLKTELDGTYKDSLGEFWSASAPEDLDKATYAITRNYEVAITKEGTSATWTNANDATANVQDWLKRRGYAGDIYDKYGNLAGSGYTPGSSCGLISGGMTLAQAKAFMGTYKNLTTEQWTSGTATEYDINGTNCAESSLANCVAFSQYFINRYTTKKLVDPGDGKSVVSNLLAIGFTDGGHIPKVYAVFSVDGNTYGHTGVVLGINTDEDKIIIGEAGCGLGLDWIDAREHSLKDFSSDKYTYAYTDDALKAGSIQ